MDAKGDVSLCPIERADLEAFFAMMDEAFAQTGEEEFDPGMDMAAHEEVRAALDDPSAHVVWLVQDGARIGGAVVEEDTKAKRNMLVWLFVDPKLHSRGLGTKAWFAIERAWPDTAVWELGTPYADKRNINFYVNKCGFHIVEYINDHHREAASLADGEATNDKTYPNNSFRFEKAMKPACD